MVQDHLRKFDVTVPSRVSQDLLDRCWNSRRISRGADLSWRRDASFGEAV